MSASFLAPRARAPADEAGARTSAESQEGARAMREAIDLFIPNRLPPPPSLFPIDF